MFFGVAAVAALLYARAVGIVTALTAGVPPIDLSRLPLVAGLAGLHCEGFVRKASVALATLAVAFALGRQGHLLSVAARASGRVVLGQPKLVRCVAAHAGHCLGVESLVASRVRVAARAGSRSGSGGVAGVRIVARGAGRRLALCPRVVRLARAVTSDTRAAGVGLHVMRAMTRVALSMGRNAPAAQDRSVFMTRTAAHHVFGTEVVGPMTPGAFLVPFGEERGRRHDGFLLGVAAGAAEVGGLARRVLRGVTGGAYLLRRLAFGGVGGVHTAVAGRAARLFDGRLCVGLMTGLARLGAVHDHRRNVAFGVLAVAALTIPGPRGRLRVELGLLT